VEAHVRSYVAPNVKLPEASPWHLVFGVLSFWVAMIVRTPRGKPVASCAELSDERQQEGTFR
jgi:hypothetical protein